MTAFDFDSPPSHGTNRSGPVTDCETCGGDRLVPVEDDPHGPYARCPSCNPAPAAVRPPVETASWWKE